MDTTKFKTEQEKAHQEKLRHVILQHCVSCHQQLDLLQLRLVNFDDLITGVKQTIRLTNKQLKEIAAPTDIPISPTEQPLKLKKV